MATLGCSRRNPIGLFAVCGIVAPIVFMILVLIAGFLTPGYSQFSQTVSELGEVGAAYASLGDANFVLTGILTILFIIGLNRGISVRRASRSGSVLLLAYPVAFVFVGTVFPLPSPVHVPLGSIAFLVTIIGILVTSQRMKGDNLWRRWVSYSLVTGVVLVGLFFVYGFAMGLSAFASWSGLFQRIVLAPYFLWNEVMAIRLYKVPNRP